MNCHYNGCERPRNHEIHNRQRAQATGWRYHPFVPMQATPLEHDIYVCPDCRTYADVNDGETVRFYTIRTPREPERTIMMAPCSHHLHLLEEEPCD